MMHWRARVVVRILLGLCSISATDVLAEGRGSTAQPITVVDANEARRVQLTQEFTALRQAFLRALSLRDTWQYPIRIEVSDSIGKRATTAAKSTVAVPMVEHGSGILLRVTAWSGERFEFARDVLTALLVELSYRHGLPKVEKPLVLPPPWVVEGLLATLYSDDVVRDRYLLRALLAKESTLHLGRFLRRRVPRADSRLLAVYRFQARALLEALCTLPAGRACLAAYLSQPQSRSHDGRNLLAYFPSLLGNESLLNRKWTLALAQISTEAKWDVLSPQETMHAFQAIAFDLPQELAEHSPERANSVVNSLRKLLQRRDARVQLQQKAQALWELIPRANPVYRPVLEEYGYVISELRNGIKKRLIERLVTVGRSASALQKQVAMIETCLRQVEQTQLESRQSAFIDEERNAVEPVEERVGSSPSDPISAHLDAWEAFRLPRPISFRVEKQPSPSNVMDVMEGAIQVR